MIVHTIRDYLLFMFFSFMIDYTILVSFNSICFQDNFHTRREELLYELNSSDIIRSETGLLTIVD